MAGDGKEGFVPYVYCAPQGATITDDIQIGARSTYLTSAARSGGPSSGSQSLRDAGGGGGGVRPGAGGAGSSNHPRPRDSPPGPPSSYHDKTTTFQPSSKPQNNHTQASAYYNSNTNYNIQVAAHNVSNTSSAPSGGKNSSRGNTSASSFVKNATHLSHNQSQPQPHRQNISGSFTRGIEYNSSRLSNNRSNSSYNTSVSQSSHSKDQQDYINMDNRSRYARFQNHRYENVNVRNGARGQGHGQGHVRHSSEDRTYGQQQRAPQASHTRYHSLDRGSGYYRPLQHGGRLRHSSHDLQPTAQARGSRQRSLSNDRHHSNNLQGQQGQGRGGNQRQGQTYHVQQSVNNHRQLNNMNLSHGQGAGHLNNNHYKQGPARLGHGRAGQQEQVSVRVGQGRAGQQELDSVRVGHGRAGQQELESVRVGHGRAGQQELDSVGSWGDQDRSSASDTPLLDMSEVTSFIKRPHGRYIVLFPFTGQVSTPHTTDPTSK